MNFRENCLDLSIPMTAAERRAERALNILAAVLIGTLLAASLVAWWTS